MQGSNATGNVCSRHPFKHTGRLPETKAHTVGYGDPIAEPVHTALWQVLLGANGQKHEWLTSAMLEGMYTNGQRSRGLANSQHCFLGRMVFLKFAKRSTLSGNCGRHTHKQGHRSAKEALKAHRGALQHMRRHR
jgi:hypothetical protein